MSRYRTRIHDAPVDVDNRHERGNRPAESPCCGDAAYPSWDGAAEGHRHRVALVCLTCGQAFAECGRGGWVRRQTWKRPLSAGQSP